jgi:hypothetical protein
MHDDDNDFNCKPGGIVVGGKSCFTVKADTTGCPMDKGFPAA